MTSPDPFGDMFDDSAIKAMENAAAAAEMVGIGSNLTTTMPQPQPLVQRPVVQQPVVQQQVVQQQVDWGDIDKLVADKQTQPPQPPPTTTLPDIEDCLIGKGTPFKPPRSLSQAQKLSQPDVKKRLQMSNHPQPPPRSVPLHNPQYSRSNSGNLTGPISMTKELPTSARYMGFTRYMILEVLDDVESFTKVLEVVKFKGEGGEGGERGRVYLRGDWFWCLVKKNDIFNIVSPSNTFLTTFSALPIIFDTDPAPNSTPDDLLFILNPDHIVSPSYVVEQLSCQRKAALKHRMKGSSFQQSRPGILGTIAHELFEKTVGSNSVTLENFNEFADEIVKKNSLSLIACDIIELEAKSHLMSFIPHIQEFTKVYTSIEDGSGGENEANGGSMTIVALQKREEEMKFRATRVNATEEELLVPHLGLSGNVDVTFEAEQTLGPNQLVKSLVAMELKTGNKQDIRSDHTAQLSLYTLMLKAAHGSNTPSNNSGAGDGGVLLYLNKNGFLPAFILPAVKTAKTLMAQRNQLASNLIELDRNRGVSTAGDGKTTIVSKTFEPAKLPPIADDRTLFDCGKCYSRSACMLYKAAEIKRKNTEDPEGEERPWLAEILRESTKHLSREHLKYFEEWDRMLDMEQNQKTKVSCFIDSARIREKKTRKTISTLTWLKQAYLAADKVEGQDCELKFERDLTAFLSQAIEGEGTSTQSSTRSNAGGIDRLHFEKGNRVIISSDATIFDCGEKSTSVGGRHELHIVLAEIVSTGRDFVSVRCSKAYAEKLKRFTDKWQKLDDSKSISVKFRIDLNEWGGGMGIFRENLMKLFRLNTMRPSYGLSVSESAREAIDIKCEDHALKWLRGLVVDLKPPSFEKVPRDTLFALAGRSVYGCDLEDLCIDFYSVLNEDQQLAVERVIGMKDYTVIQGLPGSGKTSTICFLIRLMVARGMKVLVSSYTHSAVDTLLTKLMESGFGKEEGAGDVVRLGLRAKSNDSIEEIRPEKFAQKKYNGTSGEHLMQVVNDAVVVGCTCLSMNKMSLLKNKKFDVVIIDEAGQITQPAILGPLFFAEKFVLVGDHLQMAPLVTSETALAAGYDVSLMRRLAENFDGCEPVVKLTLQYRMHSDICYLVNEVCYKGLLKCGTDEVRDGVVSYKQGWESGSIDRWLKQTMQPQNVVTFLDTDGLGSELETKAGEREIYNKTEVNYVSRIVKALSEKGGISLSDIGVISPYRAQVTRHLKEDPYLHSCTETGGLEINTIDTYQGRDKKVIIISFVKSNENGEVGSLLKDDRRLNVALSRAKMKLIMVGSLNCLRKGSETLDRVLGKVVDRDWVVKLGGEGGGGKENRFSQGSDVFRFASSKTPVKFDVSKAVWLDEKNKQAAKSAKRLRKSD
ncbi:hypothetical protein TrLO_g9325 [Triparma laevis f. longispina]|uniref:DNA replication ATP-dependent helicase/nuclease n=1 Tax=Triparma laevis f. longispina TaxID=1714387 RepID=A0A9W7DTQ3_9STRA|nr:hypothetical protein TrLO_g9325 [Triparma laevis f. longispina]